ncbi:type II CAAX prenyl endopeptidase Rce1 family protein [Nocardiopsis sp. MG754419]|uniref:CPBP family glutamic-type intramembrane protease n=1 Tax=Nocardiopsis sp. MG754419 TaxID=2259865 RepID=UPI001BACCC73|nr:CPBP family glutamic-type intramembrane protease [Nocardiopsis sp. MG754419]MBR8743620.1 CPBP family intramembrane metalloprotease [Nocardiopsis sp. MG754419]
MPWSEILPQFSLIGTLLTILLLFFAAFGEPFLGRRAFAWLSRREGDGRALELLYAVTMAVHLLWGLLVLAVVLTSPELHPVDLGLRFPDAWGPVVGGALGGLVALTAFWLLVNGRPTADRYPALAKLPGVGSKRGRKDDDAGTESSGGRGRRGHRGRRGPAAPMTLPEPGHRQHLLLPRTRKERAFAAGMAVTGGVFGELLYRGLFIVLVASMDVPLWIAAVLSVVLFSVAHVYQGWWGLLSAGFSGTLFTVLYLGTGSLVVPIIVHVALNLRSIVFPPAAELAKAEEYDDRDGDDGYDDYDRYDDEDDYYDDDEYEEEGTGEFASVEAAPGPADATRAMPSQEPPSAPSSGTPPFGGPSPSAWPGPQGPPAGDPFQGPPAGGPRQGPPPGDPRQGPPRGTPPQGPPAGGPYQGPSHTAPPQGPPAAGAYPGPSHGAPPQGPLQGAPPGGPYPHPPHVAPPQGPPPGRPQGPPFGTPPSGPPSGPPQGTPPFGAPGPSTWPGPHDPTYGQGGDPRHPGPYGSAGGDLFSQEPPAQPRHAPGDFLYGDPPSYPDHGREPDERPYPGFDPRDHPYGPGDDTPGRGTRHRD